MALKADRNRERPTYSDFDGECAVAEWGGKNQEIWKRAKMQEENMASAI